MTQDKLKLRRFAQRTCLIDRIMRFDDPSGEDVSFSSSHNNFASHGPVAKPREENQVMSALAQSSAQ
jgi:hypothetical protein